MRFPCVYGGGGPRSGGGGMMQPITARRNAQAFAQHAPLGPAGLSPRKRGEQESLAAAHEYRRNALSTDDWKPHRRRSVHTLYISPLKALAVDIARNLELPVGEMKLDIRMETRTGDTSAHKRQRQKIDPPDMLLTTPEQLALLLASRQAADMFRDLDCVVLDELHALVANKRGDLLALDLARLTKLAPQHRRVGLSATVADPDHLRRYLVPQTTEEPRLARLVVGQAGAKPNIHVLDSVERIPWAGHSGRHAIPEVMAAIRRAKMAILFVNTRSQAEFLFQELWRNNTDDLPIALHHGSLDAGQRRKVEAAMAAGRLRAVVATSTLDLGIDWGDVDLVVQMGAPKGVARMQQRIGRANHRLDESSMALLVPSNRFEVLECIAAREAVAAGKQDGETRRIGGLDVLAQHILGMACAEPFDADDLYDEVTSAEPYRLTTRETFDQALDFVATGGYALRNYERFAKLRQSADGKWRVANPMVAQRYRLNAGTIIEAEYLNVRLVRSIKPDVPIAAGRVLGKMEEFFFEHMTPGDSFVFGGRILKFITVRETDALVTLGTTDSPMVPSWQGGKFPLTTYLAERVREMIADPEAVPNLPTQVAEWLAMQAWRSVLPDPNQMLVETFPRGDKSYLVCYPFDGRLAHQTLGMLLTRRLERMGMRPLGFVAGEYALSVWALRDLSRLDMNRLFAPDLLGDDLEEWLAESIMLKRQFRNCAIIGGLIETRFAGKEKSGRQVTFSSDLIYDVLKQHQPDHILMRAAREDALTGLLDLQRLANLLHRIQGRIIARDLDHVSPLAVPVLLEIGKEPVYGQAHDDLLSEAADNLVAEASRV
ncbi:MAG: ligase-associated DNA damage response DEXH box helicase [Alphaproteobacteria bacterium]|nr:ligase-associated DNA damage response DEXH box helicase [Alphaproteobacteria bacterium]